MSIEFYCNNCSKQLRVADDKAGKKCKCPSCQTTLAIPSVGEPTGHPKDHAESEDFDIKVEIGCPKCQSLLLYSPDLEGTRGLCKACGHIFTLTQDAVVEVEQTSFPFQCPVCQFMFEGKPGMEGRKGKCTECSHVFEIKPMEATPKPTLPTRASAISEKSPAPKPIVSLSLSHPSFEDEPLEPLRPTLPSAKPVASGPVIPSAKPVVPVAIPVIPASQPPVPVARPISPTPSNSSTGNQGWDSLPVPGPAISQGSNPYAPTVTTSTLPTQSYGSRSLVTGSLITQLRALGIIYIILGSLGMLWATYVVVVTIVGLSNSTIPISASVEEQAGRQLGRFLVIVVAIAIPIVQVIVIMAGVSMLRFRGRNLAIVGSILSLVPIVSPLCLVGIPFGIWGLIVLLQSETERLFR